MLRFIVMRIGKKSRKGWIALYTNWKDENVNVVFVRDISKSKNKRRIWYNSFREHV